MLTNEKAEEILIELEERNYEFAFRIQGIRRLIKAQQAELDTARANALDEAAEVARKWPRVIADNTPYERIIHETCREIAETITAKK